MCWRLPQTNTNTVSNPVPPRQSDVRVNNVTEVMIFPKGFRTEGNIITEGNISPIPRAQGL